MSSKPFILGGLASLTAEFGEFILDALNFIWLGYLSAVECVLYTATRLDQCSSRPPLPFRLPSSIGTFPIDTTKTRLQVQGQAVERALQACRYRGMLDAFVKISREEGPTALYRG